MNTTSKRNNVCAVIPFYNEEKFIRDIILRPLPYVDLIFAINDRSANNFLQLFPYTDKVLLISPPLN